MLKRLYKSLTSSSKPSTSDKSPSISYANSSQEAPEIISRDDHCISRKQISKNALTVIYDLRRAGYEAYLVGGGVRDLLLERSPKDFDIATNATPEQVQQTFRRARIVGRRFRIAHVRFGREIIEVTTFRGSHDQVEDTQRKNNKSQTNDQGMLVRDNVYGNLHDDAMRRDFTINALYYSIDGFSVLDYTGGIEDLKNRQIRIIGEASQRYAEDPVRMLRAIRFKAKFDFELEAETAAPIYSSGHLLAQVAPARLFDEMIKLLLSGKGQQTFKLLVEYALFDTLFPATTPFIRADKQADNFDYQLICNALANTDLRVQQGKPVTPAFLYAALLWPVVREEAESAIADGTPRLRALQLAGHYAVESLLTTIAIPKRFSIPMREIWTLQQRLETAHGKRAITVLQHPRFRAAYDFLLLREQTGESVNERGEFWTALQIEHPVDREEIRQADKKRPRRRRRPASNNQGASE